MGGRRQPREPRRRRRHRLARTRRAAEGRRLVGHGPLGTLFRDPAALNLPFNLGVGGALRAGFQYAVRYGYTHALQLDADGQHDPSEVPKLVETMRSTGAGLVIGARFAGTGEYQVRVPRR